MAGSGKDRQNTDPGALTCHSRGTLRDRSKVCISGDVKIKTKWPGLGIPELGPTASPKARWTSAASTVTDLAQPFFTGNLGKQANPHPAAATGHQGTPRGHLEKKRGKMDCKSKRSYSNQLY